jgi:hypothetical protein
MPHYLKYTSIETADGRVGVWFAPGGCRPSGANVIHYAMASIEAEPPPGNVGAIFVLTNLSIIFFFKDMMTVKGPDRARPKANETVGAAKIAEAIVRQLGTFKTTDAFHRHFLMGERT